MSKAQSAEQAVCMCLYSTLTLLVKEGSSPPPPFKRARAGDAMGHVRWLFTFQFSDNDGMGVTNTAAVQPARANNVF